MNLVNISFYLLTPKAAKSQVYISLVREGQRIQFAAGFQFHTRATNSRKKKCAKPLVRKGTEYQLDYNARLNTATATIQRIERQNPDATLVEIKSLYQQATGKAKPTATATETLDTAWQRFTAENRAGWSPGFCVVMQGLRNRLKAYEAHSGAIGLATLGKPFWIAFSEFLSAKLGLSNNTSNVNLKNLRRFWQWCQDNAICPTVPFKGMEYQKETDVFKIALKEREVETLAALDLSPVPRLERVRDLFLLEILTGQRYSDVRKVLDTANHDGASITIWQQKGRKSVRIPAHPKLLAHLDMMGQRYPDGLPEISNQKFNNYLKEICAIAGFDQTHQWQMLRGNTMHPMQDHRYNLVSSHTGRRTFCTLALRRGIDPKIAMTVTGHRSYEQFMEYVRVDDRDVMDEFTEKF